MRALPTAAAVRDALGLLPAAETNAPLAAASMDAPLDVVNDEFRAGWAAMSPGTASSVRRRTAGDPRAALPPAVAAVALTGDNGTAVPIGATGQRLLAVRAGTEGDASMSLTLAPPYDPDAEPAAVFSLTSTARLGPAALHLRWVLDVDMDERRSSDPADDAEFEVDASDANDQERE